MARGVWKPTDPSHLTGKQAARLLHIEQHWLGEMARAGLLPRYGTRHCFYYLLADVETLARDPNRLRRAENHERVCARRRSLSEAEFAAGHLIDSNHAARLLGMTREQLYRQVNIGRIASYQEPTGKPRHWFALADVVELGERRAREKEERANRPPPGVHRSHFVVRHRLQCERVVEPGDLAAWERYLGEWLTARQVAFMLHVTQTQIFRLRERGRLNGHKMRALMGNRLQCHYRKADVLALLEDPMYNKGLRHYHRHCSPEARARRAAEAQARQKPLTPEQQKALAQTARVARNEWLRSQP